jgi:dolichol kinase
MDFLAISGFIPISVLYFVFGVFAAIVAVQHNRRDETRECATNDVSISAIFFMCAFLYPFMYERVGLDVEWQQTFFIISDFVMFSFLGVLLIFVGREVVLGRREPSRKIQRGYACALERTGNFDSGKKRDSNRKVLHLIPVGVILIWYVLSVVLAPELAASGITVLGFAYFLIVLTGYGFVAMFMLAETLRLIDNHQRYYYTPDWAQKWFGSSLRKNECDTFISSIPLVLCFVPFLFGPFWIFMAVALITSLSDAAASVFGRRFGKHKLRLNKKKSWEGLVAGALSTLAFVFICYPIFRDPADGLLRWWQLALVAIGTTLVFVVIDVFSRRIVDNILNPLLCGGFMILAVMLLMP